MAKVKKTGHSAQDTVHNDENEELKGRLARAVADYQNLAKRFDKEKLEVVLRANKNLLEDLLPTIDNLERAQDHLKDPGLQMAIDSLYQLLRGYGVETIMPEIGEEFDSMVCEAIDGKEGGEEGTVAQVLTKGYKWKDGQILRPAKVIVYSGRQSS